MSGWTVPLSSSPQAPSTPGTGQNSTDLFAKSPNGFLKSSFASNPSTTPAGPPPSSARSFTPADPPPSSVTGSSQLGSGKTLFKSKAATTANGSHRKNVNPISSSTIDGDKLARFLDKNHGLEFLNNHGKHTKNTFGVPSSSPPGPVSGEEEDSYDEESEAHVDEGDGRRSDDEDGTMDVDLREARITFGLGSTMSSIPYGSMANGNSVGLNSSIMDATPLGVKRTRGGGSISASDSLRSTKRSSRPKQDSAIPSIAKSIAIRNGAASLEEEDDFIIETERILQQDLYSTEVLGAGQDHALNTGLPNVSENLSRCWRSAFAEDLEKIAPEQVSFKGVGPDESAPPMHKASFLGALQLQLRHPPPARGKQALALGRLNRLSKNERPPQFDHAPSNPTAYPKVLVDWLNDCHNPYESVNIDVQRFHPNPTAHANYWDIIFSLTLRGKLGDVIQLCKRSDFARARTAREDRKGSEGYNNVEVRNIERVVNRAVQVLERCPSLQDDNWNVTGNDWILFRKRIEQELDDLATFAEGRDRDMDPADSTFEASNFGLRSTKMGLSQSARKAESRVPWTVYQNLKAVYGILLGGTTEILAMAQDWVEATVGLTIWWTGNDDEDMAVGSVALTRRSLRQSQSRGTRLVDVNTNAAYLRRLATSFRLVTDENLNDDQLPIDTLNPVEVGLASVFEGNVEGVMGILRAFSLPVASAVADIANKGGWFDTRGEVLMNGLDESDLMTLSGPLQERQLITRDTVLMEYADALSHRDNIQGVQGAMAEEGWELSISILARLEDEHLATRTVKDLLHRLPRDSDARVDKILRTCSRFGIIAEARDITEVSITSLRLLICAKLFRNTPTMLPKLLTITALLSSTTLERSAEQKPRMC